MNVLFDINKDIKLALMVIVFGKGKSDALDSKKVRIRKHSAAAIENNGRDYSLGIEKSPDNITLSTQTT